MHSEREVADCSRACEGERSRGDLDLLLGDHQVQPLGDGRRFHALRARLSRRKFRQRGGDAPVGLRAPQPHETVEALAPHEGLARRLCQLDLRLLEERLLVLQIEIGDVAGFVLTDRQLCRDPGSLRYLPAHCGGLLCCLSVVECRTDLGHEVQHAVSRSKFRRLESGIGQPALHPELKDVEEGLRDGQFEGPHGLPGESELAAEQGICRQAGQHHFGPRDLQILEGRLQPAVHEKTRFSRAFRSQLFCEDGSDSFQHGWVRRGLLVPVHMKPRSLPDRLLNLLNAGCATT